MRTMLLTFVGALACGIALVGCGGDGDDYTGGPTGTPGPTGNAFVVSITRQNGAQSFSPNPADAGGREVVFRNDDTIVHRVVLNDGTIDTGNIAPGGTSAPVTMPTSGTHYHCSLHPDMIGAVSAAGGGEPPPCTGYC